MDESIVDPFKLIDVVGLLIERDWRRVEDSISGIRGRCRDGQSVSG
jgi:hypothetical protein